MNPATLQPDSLIRSLLQPHLYEPSVEKCELIETHISWVILAGSFAYKIKKPLDLGFLDFSSLEKRRFYCQEELRLNKRLAPSIYLAVIPIVGTAAEPRWAQEGEGEEAIEYAVKMVAFPQRLQFDRLLEQGALQFSHMEVLADYIAAFHQDAAVASDQTFYGKPETVYQPIAENFRQIREQVSDPGQLLLLTELENWSLATLKELHAAIDRRQAAGFVRECHGDMHLRNIAWFEEAPLVFDCIEFSPNLRWIDVMSEIAFLVMDLQDRRQPELAQRFVNSYLQHTGDYAGLCMLRFYQVYRAMVRAKIDAIRAHQPGIDDKERMLAESDLQNYLDLARSYIDPPLPLLIICRGMSASGKSTLSRPLADRIGAILLRSDVERKRLYGLKPLDDGRAEVGEGIYSSEAGRKTYGKLQELAAGILDGGYPVIVDAAFLQYDARLSFKELARRRNIPFLIIECSASGDVLRRRIIGRRKGVSDAGLGVLEMQLSTWRPLHADEERHVIRVDTEAVVDLDSLTDQVNTYQDPG